MASTLPLLLGVWVLAVITPGPDFVLIVRYSTSRSRRHGLMAAIGTNCGILLWATGSMLGLSVLMARLSWVYECIRLAGAAYLLYLGLRLVWSNRRSAHSEVAPVNSRTEERSLLHAWRAGFLTNAANPKAVVFFGSLLGALLPSNPAFGLRVVVIVAIVATSTIWYAIVARMFGSAPVARLYARIRRWVDRVTAAVFIALGTRLALER